MKSRHRRKGRKRSERPGAPTEAGERASATLEEQAARELAAHTATLVLVPRLRQSRGQARTDRGDQPGRGETARPDIPTTSPQAQLAETRGLAAAIDLDIRGAHLVPVSVANPATLFGRGKVAELRETIQAEGIDLVVVSHPLSPGQQRNLERAWRTKVLDRTGLILEIFGRRARTAEGRLQVELAHLTWQKTRLVRSWTHLERQRGGFGFLGGPGETQIEADRRQIDERIKAIKGALEKVRKTRALHRDSRARVPYPVVALVGYTNAGKSTLFNRLSGADVVARDQLFATLDPTMRELRLPSGRRCILSDTVGFISDLPLTLVAAFRATLEEVVAADIILHVRDISSPDSLAQKHNVEQVLGALGIEAEAEETRLGEVWNKLDLLTPDEREAVAGRAGRHVPRAVCVSAVTGEGVDSLLAMLDRMLRGETLAFVVETGPRAGAFVHWLYENTEVVSRRDQTDGKVLLHLQVPRIRSDGLQRALAQNRDARLLACGDDASDCL